MFSIGTVTINNRIIAAPMAGITDKANRIIASSFGCGMTCSEMISDMGLIYGQKKTQHIADISGEKRPISVQIFGSDPEKMAEGAIIIEEMGADIIDINMGCPTPKIVKNGEGSALMLDLPRSRDIIRSIVKAVQVPVTVKMRRGWDDVSTTCLELAGIAEQEGAQAVTLHARSRMQFYSGQADWSLIKEVKKNSSIPVIGNGDIWSADDAVRMLAETGCDAVMIGRAAMGNPFIFRETVELVEKGNRIPPPTWEERIQTAIKHLDLACSFKGEAVAVREMRKHFSWYIKGRSGAAKIRQQINTAQTRDQLIQALK
ncbi:trna dihydrouridine synthase b [hydrocarbon metagenome]|uniref:Trna dihydrouridine synthase b n=1 Tax=hydrocarbon metagenome TaxID=938273 RepID=A0A0W8E8Z6_9ZZZZ